MLCNYLQNVAAITYIFVLQLSTFLFYNKHTELRSLSAEQFHWLMQGFAIDPIIHDITPDTSV